MGLFAVTSFYAAHRFLHRKWWMAKVHRVHHEFRSTSAWSAEYAHPVEYCVANFGTMALGVVVIAPPMSMIFLFSLLSMLTFLIHHSGYAIPWASWSVHHDWHHFRYSEAFGTFGYLDRWLGTDTEFRTLEDGDYRP
jgi:methylsterol monooxygenase